MATEYTPTSSSYGQALARHDPRLRIWSAASSYTEADTAVGPGAANQDSALRVEPSGTPTTTDALDLAVERGGYPGSGMALAWRRPDEDPDVWFGWDPPVGVAFVESAHWAASGATGDLYYQPDAVALPDGRVVVCSAENDSGATAVRVLVRSAAGAWSSSVQIGHTARTYVSTSVYPWASCWYEPAPPDRPSATGYVRIAWLTYDEQTELAQIVISECPDTSDPGLSASWSIAEVAALPSGPQVAAGAIKRIRARWSGGQVALLLQQAAGIAQYASVDGLRFRAVSGTLDALEGAWDLARIGPLLTLAYCVDSGSSLLKTASVGDAFSAFANAVLVSVFGTAGSYADPSARVMITEGDSGTGWLYLSHDSSAAENGYAFQTRDGGQTWIGVTGDTSAGSVTVGAPWMAGTSFDHGAAVGWRDRVLAVVRTYDTGGYQGSLLCLHLGGSVDIAQPWRSDGVEQIRRWTWARSWVPTVAPGSVFTENLVGPPVAVWTTGASYRVTTSGGQSATWSGSASGAYTATARQARCAVSVNSGTAYLQVRYGDGTESFGAYAEITATGLQLKDLDSHANIGSSATITQPVEVKVAVYKSSAKAYWRTWTADGDGRAWNLLASTSGTLTDSGALGAYEGVAVAASSVVEGLAISMSTGLPSALVRHGGIVRSADWITTTGVDEVAHPGRPIGGNPAYYSHGIYLRAQRGPGRVGHTWATTPTASKPVTRAAFDATYPSPADGWLPPTTGAQTVAYRLYDTDAEDCDTECPLWLAWIQTDAPTVAISWNEAGAWGSSTTYAMYALVTATRHGNTLVLDEVVTSTAGAVFLERDELAGSYVYNSAGDALRIASHTAGVLLADTDDERQTPVFVLDGVDGTEDATSRAWRIHFGRVVLPIIAPERARGIRVVESAPDGIPASGRRHSKHLIGPALLLGNPHGKNGSTVTNGNISETEMEGGQVWRREVGEARRTREVSWSDTQHHRRAIQAALADPDFIRPWATGSARAAYSRGALSGEVAAVVRSWATGPVLYVPSYVRSSQSTDPLVGHRCRGSIVGMVDAVWTVEETGGVESRTDVVRPGSLRLREVV